MKKIIYILAIAVVSFFIIRVAFSYLILGSRIDKPSKKGEVVDITNRRYVTEHFYDECEYGRKLSVYDGKNLYYVNEDAVYKYGEDSPILQDIFVQEMVASKERLFVVDSAMYLHIVNLNSGDEKIIEGIENVVSDGKNIYVQPENCIDIKCLIDDKVADCKQTDDYETIKFWTEGYYNRVKEKYYIAGCSIDQTSVSRLGEADKKLVELDKHYYIDNNNFFIVNDNAYVLYNCKSTDVGFDRLQNQVRCDGIVMIDFKNEKSKEVYQTKDNSKKIIGYEPEKNTVYEYDTTNQLINKIDLESDNVTEIYHFERSYNHLEFEMNNNKMLVYGKDFKLIKLINLDK